MTPNEVLSLLLRANLALATGVMLVMILRLPARRIFGARAAYGLWLLPLIAAIAVLAPARTVTVLTTTPRPEVSAPAPIEQTPAVIMVANADSADPQTVLAALWLVGVAAFAVHVAVRQRRFLKAAAAGEAGPAAVGVLRLRIVLPADFEVRFTTAEREAVLAHEQAHIDAQHPRINAGLAMMQALCWFNPLAHLAAHLSRLDQELACDAAVVAKTPALRRLYAETLLKTQLAATPLPLGCYWPARAEHPLTQRITMLTKPSPARARRMTAAALITVAAAATGLAAWAAQPPTTVFKTFDLPTRRFSMVSDRAQSTPQGTLVWSGNVVLKSGQDEFHADRLVMPSKNTLPQPDRGAPPTQATSPAPAPLNDKSIALAAGDWSKAASLGATAPEVVRALQAKGRYGEINPDEAVVSIPPDGEPVVTPMKPLPTLPGETAGSRIAPLRGSGFTFAAKPGTVILYPPGSPPLEGRAASSAFITRTALSQPTAAESAPAPAQPAPRFPPGWRAFAAVFDGNAPVLLKGAVTSVEWVRPRILLHMVDAATGQAWKIEAGDPEAAAANGWTRERLANGTPIVVRGYQSKGKICAPECLANARAVTFPGGEPQYVGSRGSLPAQPAARNDAKSAAINAAQADRDLALQTYEGADKRYQFGLIPSLDVQKSKRDVAAAEARLAVAKAAPAALRAPVTAPASAQSDAKAATINAAQADRDLALLSYLDAEKRFQAGLITALDLQGSKRDVAAAEARLAMAKAQ